MLTGRIGKASLAVSAICLLALCATGGATAGYGPPIPPGPPIPGGFSIVITSRVVDPDGGTILATYGETTFRLDVPNGALDQPTRLTLTRPLLLGLPQAIPRDNRLLLGFALLATKLNGAPIRGWFSKEFVQLDVSNPKISSATRVFSWGTADRRFNSRSDALSGPHTLTFKIREDSEFLIISPR